MFCSTVHICEFGGGTCDPDKRGVGARVPKDRVFVRQTIRGATAIGARGLDDDIVGGRDAFVRARRHAEIRQAACHDRYGRLVNVRVYIDGQHLIVPHTVVVGHDYERADKVRAVLQCARANRENILGRIE